MSLREIGPWGLVGSICHDVWRYFASGDKAYRRDVEDTKRSMRGMADENLALRREVEQLRAELAMRGPYR